MKILIIVSFTPMSDSPQTSDEPSRFARVLAHASGWCSLWLHESYFDEDSFVEMTSPFTAATMADLMTNSLPSLPPVYRVGWFVDSAGDVVEDVSICVAADGRLDVRRGGDPAAVDLGDVALIPGLVNVHTHLEFSLLREPIPTAGRFTDWIRSVVNYRREPAELFAEAHDDCDRVVVQTPSSGRGRLLKNLPTGLAPVESGLCTTQVQLGSEVVQRPASHRDKPGGVFQQAGRRPGYNTTEDAIRAGIAESTRCGTTLIGEIATTGWSNSDYLNNDFAGVVFQELIGLTDERVGLQAALAQQMLATDGSFGLSPHAPYSVRPDLLKHAIDLARTAARPIAMHIAESEAELELLADGTGEFRELLTEFGIWRDGLFGGGGRPKEWLEALADAPRSLIVHGNYLDEDELRFLAARPQMTLVYCPRTHAAFGHRAHPWRRLLELGGSVAFGTDSRASNPDLSLFAELQFVAEQHPDFSHLTLLDLATRGGHRALLGDESVECSTDFALVRLAAPRANNLPRDLFARSSKVIGTVRGGCWNFAVE